MITTTTTATTLNPNGAGTFGSFGRAQAQMVSDVAGLAGVLQPPAASFEGHMTGQQQQDAVALMGPGGDSPGAWNELTHLWTPVDCTALIHALVASFSVILVSELGDKTFIITAIMAMKNSRFLVFIASALALFLMTVLSVGMGVAVTVIPDVYTHYASLVLFLCFGIKMLKEAYDMNGEGGEDFDEVERSLVGAASGDSVQKEETIGEDGSPALESPANNKTTDLDDPNDQAKNSELATTGSGRKLLSRIKRTIHVAPIIIKVFTMILVAEWGDRSQISTIILAAREDVVGVFVGSFMGHVLCTGLAVIGGRFIADMISVRTMTLLGGIVFLFFAAYELISGPEEN